MDKPIRKIRQKLLQLFVLECFGIAEILASERRCDKVRHMAFTFRYPGIGINGIAPGEDFFTQCRFYLPKAIGDFCKSVLNTALKQYNMKFRKDLF